MRSFKANFSTFDPSVTAPQRLFFLTLILFNSVYLMPYPIFPFLLASVQVQGLITYCLGYGICGTSSVHFIPFRAIQVLALKWAAGHVSPCWELLGGSLLLSERSSRFMNTAHVFSRDLALADFFSTCCSSHSSSSVCLRFPVPPLGFFVSQLLCVLIFLPGIDYLCLAPGPSILSQSTQARDPSSHPPGAAWSPFSSMPLALIRL